MNPLILGLFRQQAEDAALRAQAIRLNIAMNTGYLNPQEGMLRLSGLPPFASGWAAQPTAPVMPAISANPIDSIITAAGPEAYQAFADYKLRNAFQQQEQYKASVMAEAFKAFLAARS